jgi:hypothetical protein
MIVCLVHDRETIGGWILDVPNDGMAIGAEGAGRTSTAPGRSRKRGRPPGLVGYKVRKEIRPAARRPARQRLGG